MDSCAPPPQLSRNCLFFEKAQLPQLSRNCPATAPQLCRNCQKGHERNCRNWSLWASA
jgi:hypothetical protein